MRAYAESIMKPDAEISIGQLEVTDALVQVVRDAYAEQRMIPQFSYTGAGESVVNHNFRHSYTIMPPFEIVNQDIMGYVKAYAEKNFNIDWARDEVGMSTFELMAYPPGVGIGMHFDDSVWKDGQLVATDYYRSISTILYLNDDFEGGEIYFNKQDMLIRPTRGMFIIFPSNKFFSHEVKPITSGLRLSYQRMFAIWHDNNLEEK